MMTRTLPIALILALASSAACRRTDAPTPGQQAEAPTLYVTSWTDQTELYMEHPPLVAGQTLRFAVHLTRLADFRALDSGRPSIEMRPEAGGPAVVLPGSEALRPGAFRVEGKLPPAGRYHWALVVSAPALSDRHDLGTTTVFADEVSAVADAGKQPEKDAAAIAYLKEQQWTNPFATALVRDGDVRTSIRVPAAIEPVTGGEAMIRRARRGGRAYRRNDTCSVGVEVSAKKSLPLSSTTTNAGKSSTSIRQIASMPSSSYSSTSTLVMQSWASRAAGPPIEPR